MSTGGIFERGVKVGGKLLSVVNNKLERGRLPKKNCNQWSESNGFTCIKDDVQSGLLDTKYLPLTYAFDPFHFPRGLHVVGS